MSNRPQLCISSTVLGFATSLSTPPSPSPTTSTLGGGDEGMREKEGVSKVEKCTSIESIQHQHTAKCLATVNSGHLHERSTYIYDLNGDTIFRNRHIAYSNITTNSLKKSRRHQQHRGVAIGS